MKQLLTKILEHKELTVPILSFPSTKLLNISVNELISSAENQARGMEAIVNKFPVGAALNMMDLSVEAEAFGAEIKFSENEIPTVKKGVIENIDQAMSLAVPSVGAGRTGLYIEGVALAKKRIKNKPVFCGVIGPYSLAGRLFDMTELMMECFDSPEKVMILLAKCTAFITEYIKAFKAAGADGVIVAEPAAGLLSPDLCGEFSTPYVKEIKEAVDSPDFLFCYHNCGGSVPDMCDSIAETGADIYHFGNAIRLSEVLPKMPETSIIMGNIDPLLFRSGTPEQVKSAVDTVYNECKDYPNFMLSSGCDIPADADIKNLEAYFDEVSSLI